MKSNYPRSGDHSGRREPSFLLTAIANSLLLFVICNSFGYAAAARIVLQYVPERGRFWVGGFLGTVMVGAGLWSAWSSCGWKFRKKFKLSLAGGFLAVGIMLAIGIPSRSAFSYGARDIYYIVLCLLGLAVVSTLVFAPLWAVFARIRKRRSLQRAIIPNSEASSNTFEGLATEPTRDELVNSVVETSA